MKHRQTQTRKQLVEAILAVRNSGTGRKAKPVPWRDVALRLYPDGSVSGALLWRIANTEYQPSAAVCRRLKIRQPVEVSPCPECGEAHVVDWCTKDVPAVKGRQKRVRKHKPRIAIRKDDMQSAAQSIVNNLEPEKVQELIAELTRRKGDVV